MPLAQQGGVREQEELHQAGDQGGQDHAAQQPPAAVLLLQGRPDHQQQHDVADKVGIIGMAQHMGKHPHIGQRVGERGAVDAEQQPGTPAPREHPKNQRPQGQQGEGQHHRRVILQAQRPQ